MPSGRAPGVGVAQYLGRPRGLSQAKLREPIYTQNALQPTILIENIGDEEPFWKQVTIASIDTSEEKCSRQACLINQSTTNVVLFYVAAESRDVKFRFSATPKRISPNTHIMPQPAQKMDTAQDQGGKSVAHSTASKRKAAEASSTIHFTSRNPPWTYLKLQLCATPQSPTVIIADN